MRLANDSQYGLSASVWSADLGAATGRRALAGNVSVNNVMLTGRQPRAALWWRQGQRFRSLQR